MPGRLYNERTVEQTYSSFATLRALRNVNIRFSEVEENDTMKLNCTILTSPAKLQGFGVDLEGTNSAGDFGFRTCLYAVVHLQFGRCTNLTTEIFMQEGEQETGKQNRCFRTEFPKVVSFRLAGAEQYAGAPCVQVVGH